jgi:N-hydroxyarylamine O-acetyltransferase
VTAIDLAAYLHRIGFNGTPRPDLATLRDVHRLHAAAIPFENLSAFVGEPISLEPAALEAKLVRSGRGGWCFEHNLLLRHALEAIGFEVTSLAARVRWNVPPNVTTPRSHCLLRVPIEGKGYIADVGFGGLTLTAPLRLHDPGEQATPHETFRIVPREGAFALDARIEGEWQTMYVFEPHAQHQADYEVSNWYLAHHPQSQFVNGVIAARALPGERHALRNTRYAIHRPGEPTERREITEAAEMRALLAGPFGIQLDALPGLDQRLARLFATV